ncbi:MAG: PPC domain-containing protein [Candidatus Thorarchaeota archaeon]
MGINKKYRRGIFLLSLVSISTIGIFFINPKQEINLFDENLLSLSDPEDNYEYNDDIYSAWDFTYIENVWLSSINGTGTQWDDDYYMIWVDYDSKYLRVNLTFTHIFNDMNLTIYDSAYFEVDKSDTNNNNEYIEIFYPIEGVYYILVDGNNTGTIYDLWWQTDDIYEDNDNYWDSIWLDPNYYSNLKIAGDDNDWFHVYLNMGDTFEVYIYFDNWEGNLQLELYSPFDTITPKVGSYSNTENYEYFSFSVAESGDWRIRIYHAKGNSSVNYDLDIWRYTGDDWMEENDDFWSAWWVNPNYYGGLIIKEYDDDWFRIYLDQGDKIEVSIKSFDNNIGNLDLELFAPFDELNPKDGSYGVYSNDEFISYTAEESGEWRIRVFRVSGNFLDFVYYDLVISLYKGEAQKEDAYEYNDDPDQAFNLCRHEKTWLSEIRGLAVQGTEDWYLIEITPGYERLIVNLQFNSTYGNIYISISDRWGSWYISNWSMTGLGDIDIDSSVPHSGEYLLQIHGDFMGNTYNLWWDDLRTDFRAEDNYEENDDALNAFDLTQYIDYQDQYGIMGRPLEYIMDNGIQSDNDWFKLTIGSEFLGLRVIILYEYSEGPIGIVLYDRNLAKLASNFTMSDNEYLRYALPSNGTYYLRIYGTNSGSPYDLRWELRGLKEKMIPGFDILITLCAIFGVVTVLTIKLSKSKKNH